MKTFYRKTLALSLSLAILFLIVGTATAGMFETKPIEEVKPGLELVTKLAKEKIDKNRKTG